MRAEYGNQSSTGPPVLAPDSKTITTSWQRLVVVCQVLRRCTSDSLAPVVTDLTGTGGERVLYPMPNLNT